MIRNAAIGIGLFLTGLVVGNIQPKQESTTEPPNWKVGQEVTILRNAEDGSTRWHRLRVWRAKDSEERQPEGSPWVIQFGEGSHVYLVETKENDER